MEGFDIPSLIELYGLPGLIIGYLIWENRALRGDNKDLNKELRETMREVFPVVTTLQAALEVVRGADRG